ncbi:winged helix-turn-helix domain-containing protein [Dactylosporangium sp. NBC_01737]|uniref:AfsR/SARP family transcriptional regulator n=1 Tax=Dactylosporangium sp. NBC_01737 TaxID=2975959 RepID=UPI002E0E104F|nr:winged helix-turn-helix domain-containing protein [Dactylosporangium sp. NBC_01737]
MNGDDLRFGVLGPLTVHSGARGAMQLRSPKYRIVLAALLLAPGRTVPVAELAEAVWGTRPPADARRALQLHILRVRAAFAQSRLAPVIVSDPGGYRIDVDPGTVDTGSLARLLGEADAAAHRDDPDAEAAALRGALTLWRGEPLCDVPSDLLHRTYVPALDKQRLSILTRFHDLGLRLGRLDETAESALQYLGRYPLAEPLWRQLVTALHRAGRRADALQAYERARQRFADDLAVAPGPALRQLHASVLADRLVTADRAGPPGVPRQVPNAIAGFVARTAELRQLEALVGGGDRRPVAVTGTGGIGKTALAAYVARRAADTFPDGQLWIDLRGYDARPALPPAQALTILLGSLGVPGTLLPADLDGLTRRYRSVMAGRRALVVLDNARDAAQVRALLPGRSPSLVLVTSRRTLGDMTGGHVLRLGPFDRAAGRALLVERLGAARVERESAAADGIVELCEGLPLALAVAAARALAHPAVPLARLHRQLRYVDAPLDRFAGSDARADVRTVLSWSYLALRPRAAALLRRLGQQPGLIVRECFAADRAALDELVEAHLITERRAGAFGMHPLVHAYAAEQPGGRQHGLGGGERGRAAELAGRR